MIGEDHANRVVILTGSGDAFMDAIGPEGFDFFSPQGYGSGDSLAREGISAADVARVGAQNTRARSA